ncbi:hypothetical protein [Romboutsia sp. MSSM.1001216sp_RTP31141st1_G3_RTP31141_220114]|uniref:hypothetical protein n=1 Tax=unclassified Romboutsia TaxID=2626894 RepID=UPI0031B6267D
MEKKRYYLMIVVGFIFICTTVVTLVHGKTKNNSSELKEIVTKEEIDPEEFIKVNVIDLKGNIIELDEAISSNKLELKHNYLVEVHNTNKEYEFEGTVKFENVDLMENYGTLKIEPGHSANMEMKFNNNDVKYTISGKMKKVIDHRNEYNILGSAVKGENKENVFIGIEQTDDLLNAEEIVKDFIDNYKGKKLNMLTVYIYEEGYTLKDTLEMSKDAIYEIIVHREKDEYKYYLYKKSEGKCIEKGVLK